MNKQTYYAWYNDWATNREHERLGQAFVNDFIKEPWPELFHCTSNERAGQIIYYWLTDHQYWPTMPTPLSKGEPYVQTNGIEGRVLRIV